ncbi:hypothetical protein BD414DRAFT_505759 [Trametes punicea]|nr:hypothetical protein BD414DRAFT_505759 [Trametes punicea]
MYWKSLVEAAANVLIGPDGNIITTNDESSTSEDPHEPTGDAETSQDSNADNLPTNVSIAEQTTSDMPSSITPVKDEAPTSASISAESWGSLSQPAESASATALTAFVVVSHVLGVCIRQCCRKCYVSPRINSASSPSQSTRTTSFYIGIAFAAIAGAGLIVAVLAWWLRIRSRSRRRTLSRMTTWPWDHHGFEGRQLSLEGGLGTYGAERNMAERLGGIGGRPTSLSTADHDYSATSGCTVPLPPPPAHMQGGQSSPYVTVQLHDAHQSVPDLAPDLGTLQITNLAPGDISGGESSRASTALGVLNTYPAEYGTPFQPQRPCFLGVENGGLEVPWRPLQIRRTGTTRSQQPNMTSEVDEKLNEALPLPYPEDIAISADGPPVASRAREESWAASIRSNLLNAFNAVVGANPSQLSIAADTFTHRPHRNSQRSRVSPRGPRDGLSDIRRSTTAGSTSSTTGWSLAETQSKRGDTHVRSSGPEEDPFADDAQIPPRAAIVSGGGNLGLLSAPPPGSVTRASSMYSTASNDFPVERIGNEPPQLPSIASLTRLASEESSDARPQERDISRHSGRIQRRKQTRRPRRPTLATRKSSSQNSATSVGSEMSRTSSASSEHLTDGERFAKHALRERRRRVMEMTVGRNKTRRSKATTLSRRRSNERLKQNRE